MKFALPAIRRHSPIGVDISPRSVKLVQLDGERGRVLEAVRWDANPGNAAAKTAADVDARIVAALCQAREGRRFRGRDAVLCLDGHDLLIANVRIPKQAGGDVERLVYQEAAGRISFGIDQAEIRYLDGAEVRQGDTAMRELTLLAAHRPAIARKIALAERAGLRPVAIDAAPVAMLRSFASQYRRDEDRKRRTMFAHIGAGGSLVVIAQGGDVLFAKHLELGGKQLDEAIARHLHMTPADAVALRRHNGDRRADQQDPEITRSVAESIRPVIEQLILELSKCIRYHSVTFRGQPLSSLVVSGGEASATLVQTLTSRLDVTCELGDPLRALETNLPLDRRGQWDVAAGLAMKVVK